MSKSDGVVIIGGSIAGHNVARQLRKDGYENKITLVDAKNTLPYDRSELSTKWMQDLDKVEPPLFQKKDFFIDKEIKLMLNTEVISVDSEEKRINFASNESIFYNKLVLATGSKLRKLDLEGEEGLGIFYLRDHEDALEIKEWSKETENLVIVGGGFIGLELAASFSKLGLNVTVIEYEDYPLEQRVGKEVAKYFMKMHKSHGVEFITGEAGKAFKKDNTGKLRGVVTTEGKEIKAEMAIIAVGVEPNLSVNIPDLETEEGVFVNKYGETNIKDIYAVGDLAIWPYKGDNIHVEHWEHAYNQGQNVARNIIKSKSLPYNTRPYFWTDQYDQTFERLGHVDSWHEMIVRGSLGEGKFTVAYVDDDMRPLAILFANNADKRKEVSEFMDRNRIIDKERFKNLQIPLSDF